MLNELPREVIHEHVVPHLTLKDYISLTSTCHEQHKLLQGVDGIPLPPAPPKALRRTLDIPQDPQLKGLLTSMERQLRWFVGTVGLHRCPKDIPIPSEMEQEDRISQVGLYGVKIRTFERNRRVEMHLQFDFFTDSVHSNFAWDDEDHQVLDFPASPNTLTLYFFERIFSHEDVHSIVYSPGLAIHVDINTGEMMYAINAPNDTVLPLISPRLEPWKNYLQILGKKGLRGLQNVRSRIIRYLREWQTQIQEDEPTWNEFEVSGFVPMEREHLYWHINHRGLTAGGVSYPTFPDTGVGGYICCIGPRNQEHEPVEQHWLDGTWYRPPIHGWCYDLLTETPDDTFFGPRLGVGCISPATARALMGLLWHSVFYPRYPYNLYVRGKADYLASLNQQWSPWKDWVKWHPEEMVSVDIEEMEVDTESVSDEENDEIYQDIRPLIQASFTDFNVRMLEFQKRG